MTEFVDSTVKEIDSRLTELKQEVGKLEAARAALVGTRLVRPGITSSLDTPLDELDHGDWTGPAG